MNAQIFSHEKLIGTAEIQVGDENMGHVYGNLSPTENYYNYVQPAVWEFWASNKPDYIKWGSLKFNVQLDNGCFLFAAGGLTFDDLKESQAEKIRIDIAGVDRYIIDDFFLQIEPRPFVVEPWETISIGQKIAFEEELKKELGIINNPKSILKFLKSTDNDHVLSNFEAYALCHDGRCDDVLFRVRKDGFDKEFALVHLTWRGNKEAKGWPNVSFYDDYDDFKYSKMYPDKADWEY